MFNRLRETLVFSVSVVYCAVVGFPDIFNRITVCKDKEPLVLNCSKNRIISIKKTLSVIQHCNQGCDTSFLERVKELCDGKNTCSITSDIFPNECSRFARYLRIDIDCSGFWSGPKTHRFFECSNSLSKINCRNYWKHHINIQGIDVLSQPKCNNLIDQSCDLNRLRSLCDEKSNCSEETNPSSCLFGRQAMHIFYFCSGNSSQTTGNTPTSVFLRDLPTSTREEFTGSTEAIERKDEINSPNQMTTTAISPSSQESIGNTEHAGLIVGIVVGLILVCLVGTGTLFSLKRINFFKTNESEGDNHRFRTEMREANENQNYDCLEIRNPNGEV